MSIFSVVPVTVSDYERRARRCLPRFLYDYAAGGANNEETLSANCADFSKIRLRQRVMYDVSRGSTDTTLLGQPASMPLALAPVGMAGMYARRGEVQAAKASETVGIPFTGSTMGVCSINEINAATNTAAWFQLYMLRDRDFVQEMLQNAWDSGTRTLIFTVDLAVPGLRLRDFRNGMIGGGWMGKASQMLQLATSPGWAYDVGIRGKPHFLGNLSGKVKDAKDLNSYKSFVESQFDPSVTWEDIRWLRDQWKGQLLIKGVLEADDARAARDCGAEGVVVSNHGGRQLDAVASSISKLPAVVDAVGSETEVFIDGGIRSGLDVVRAVALGARGVLMGRPWIYALAVNGEAGVRNLLEIFQREIAIALALTGVNSVQELNRELIDSE
ncbi:L-lactate dehydrogenase [Congregibacter litoralis]|uniref:L-lactate dehydrogenase (FMN-dependent) n=1 Tax=Congregibacter litoralis KT71 TaxID=314285 RepID=A4A9T3_9GAMM|nr:L-lactate dehydrogenase [Congregibacter litoralis]EAQ97250.2 L-lactate dehydrogenase (FMN-dependent) [Congregibacter litoralis KT71]